MAKCASLALLLVFYIFFHAQSVRFFSGQAWVEEEHYEGIELKSETPAVRTVGQGNGDGPDVLHRPLSSLTMLHQSARDEVLARNRFTARSTGLDVVASTLGGAVARVLHSNALIEFAGGGLVIGLVVAIGKLWQRGRSTSSTEESDDDSDDSVVGFGDESDPVAWWKDSALSSVITSSSELPVIGVIAPPWNKIAFNNAFNECGLGASFNQGITSKLAEELRGELSQGRSVISKQSSGSEQTGLKCTSYVMQLALHYVPDNLVVQEFSHTSNDVRLPKTEIRNNEGIEECFLRLLTHNLGVSQAIAEKFANSAVLLRADEKATTGSPAAASSNILTTVGKLTVLVQLKDVADELRKDLGIDEGSLSVDAQSAEFRWTKVGEDSGLRKLLHKAPDARKVKPEWKPFGPPVLPWSIHEVNHELTSRGIAPDSFGEDLPLLVQMLKHGQVQLGIKESTGQIVCVEHRVYLKLSRRNGDILVHQGDGSTPACLPYVQLLANETPFVAALRAARTKLGSVFMRVELQLRVQDVQSVFTPKPPEMFAKGRPIQYVVRELLVEALARA